jgi:hypothetical protein
MYQGIRCLSALYGRIIEQLPVRGIASTAGFRQLTAKRPSTTSRKMMSTMPMPEVSFWRKRSAALDASGRQLPG